MKVETDAHEFFLRIAMGYRTTKVLLVANRLRLFDELDTWRSADDVARARNLDGRTVGEVLKTLAAMELVECKDRRFRNGPLAAKHLVSTQPSFVGHNLAFQDLLWENWSNLETVIRTGRPHKALGDLLGEQSSEFTREYIRGMQPLAAGPSKEIARILSDRPLERMLDVGGGPGTYTCAMLAKNHELRGTILDLATTLEVTRELTRTDPNLARITFQPGNYLSDAYGTDYDLILMSHTTHDESHASVVNMFRRAHAALRPGGRLAIHDWVLDDNPGPESLPQALFSVNLMVYTEGQVYSLTEYGEMLREAGFAVAPVAQPILAEQVPNPTFLIVATKA